MQVSGAAPQWPEADLRQRVWLTPSSAMERIEDPGLVDIIRLVLGRGLKERIVLEI
jgi:hypothetical protein